jgi:hypothetical protein
MLSVRFLAHGHQNVISEHRTTLEITRETDLTKRGTCIVGVKSSLSLSDLNAEIKSLARVPDTTIRLLMTVDGLTEEVTGHGADGLTYTDQTSMVTRKSAYTCGRTLMVHADRAASDLDRDFVDRLKTPDAVMECRLVFVSR